MQVFAQQRKLAQRADNGLLECPGEESFLNAFPVSDFLLEGFRHQVKSARKFRKFTRPVLYARPDREIPG